MVRVVRRPAPRARRKPTRFDPDDPSPETKPPHSRRKAEPTTPLTKTLRSLRNDPPSRTKSSEPKRKVESSKAEAKGSQSERKAAIQSKLRTDPSPSRTKSKQSNSDVRPYSCQQCGSAFKRSTHLKRHKLVHTKVHTKVNPSTSQTKSNHLKQDKDNSDVRPHSCHQCGMAFTRLSNLKRHFLVHTKVNPSTSQTKSKQKAEPSTAEPTQPTTPEEEVTTSQTKQQSEPLEADACRATNPKRKAEASAFQAQISQKRLRHGNIPAAVQKPRYFVIKTHDVPMVHMPKHWSVLGEIESKFIFDSPSEDGKSCVLGIGENLFITLKGVDEGIARTDEVTESTVYFSDTDVTETPTMFQFEEVDIKTEISAEVEPQKLMIVSAPETAEHVDEDVGCLTLGSIANSDPPETNQQIGSATEDSTMVHVIHPEEVATDSDRETSGQITVSAALGGLLKTQTETVSDTDTGIPTFLPDSLSETENYERLDNSNSAGENEFALPSVSHSDSVLDGERVGDSDDEYDASDTNFDPKQQSSEEDDNSGPENKTEYICTDCGKIHASLNGLKSHRRRLHGRGAVECVCQDCGATFKNREGLSTHRRRSHSETRNFVCDQCGHRFVLANQLKQHQLTHSGERAYTCDQCGRAFVRKSGLERHMERHTTSKRPYMCGSCVSVFETETELENHVSVMHASEGSSKGNDSVAKSKYGCKLCSRTFARRDGLRRHERLHTGDRPHLCGVCVAAFKTAEDLADHVSFRHLLGGKPGKTRRERDKIIACPTCDKRITVGSLKIHLRIHTGEKPFVCEVCGKAYRQAQSLKWHIGTHAGTNPVSVARKKKIFVVCPTCGKRMDKSSMRAHLLTHNGEKPYVCEVCGKAFSQPKNLRIHKSIHTGEKPHICDICGRSFRLVSIMKHHRKLHTLTREEYVEKNSVNCPTCDKTVMRFHLRDHLRTHTGERPYVCSVCGKGFIRSKALQIHNTLHTGEKPHTCDFCHKSFRLLKTMQEHRRLHTGEKPFACDVCPYRCAAPGSLRKHVKIHKGYVENRASHEGYVEQEAEESPALAQMTVTEDSYPVYVETVLEREEREEIEREEREEIVYTSDHSAVRELLLNQCS